MSRVILAFMFTLFLTGCFHNVKTDVNFGENLSHPELPNPVQPYRFDFYVITEENVEDFVNQENVFVAIQYEETLEFRKFLEDMKRFMLEANGVICYYRDDLKEAFCDNQRKYLNQNDKTE